MTDNLNDEIQKNILKKIPAGRFGVPLDIANTVKFLISDDLNKIKIFFHSKTFNLLGWETTDIYQNKVLFEISNIKKNQKINRGKFKLPNLN